MRSWSILRTCASHRIRRRRISSTLHILASRNSTSCIKFVFAFQYISFLCNFSPFCLVTYTGSTGFKKSSTSFLFTLANIDGTAGVKLDVQDTSKAIYNDVSYGPCFGDGDLVISDMAATNVNSSSRLGTSYSLPNSIADGSVDAVNFLAGSEYFTPDDLEVFHIGRKKSRKYS